ncbi:MAG: GntR family transcriptional regulator [Candidatus Cloacimonetes bacterium]|nr:GntR family transcriptional regulator [Candidatus Cloacimonadota bacterium]
MSNKTPKYLNVKEIIKDGIRTGEIVGKLPGERVMAEMYNVSYMTVRRAITELVEEGILHKFTTKGAFVSHSKMTPKITHNIGFFLDSGIKEGISSPYYSLVFEALEKEVKKKGYSLVLFSDSDDLNPINNKKKIDGAVICCFPRIENKIQELKRMLPIVLLDNLSTDKSIPSVTLDNFNSSSQAAHYLFALGHRRIGFISGLLDSDVCNERITGYTSALVSNGIKVDEKLIYNGDYSYESGEKGADYLLSLTPPPTAIMCANDSMAIGAMKSIRERGYRIPEDVSVIGFDDIKVSSMVFPSLTTITAPIERLAERVIAMLLAMIDGVDLDYQHVILPAPLTIRNSCAKVNSK